MDAYLPLVVTVVLAIAFVPGGTWLAAGAGFAGYDTVRGTFDFLPAGADFFLLAALVAPADFTRAHARW